MADQPPLQRPHYEYPDDEISLYEVWNTLVRHRLIVAIVFSLVLASIGGYAVSRTPVYLMDTVIEIGKKPSLNDEGLVDIEPPDVTVRLLNEVFIPRVLGAGDGNAAATDKSLSAIQASVVDQSAGLIRLSTELPAKWEEPVRKALGNISVSIVAAHQAELDAAISSLTDQSLANRIAKLDREVENLATQLERTYGTVADTIGNSGLEASSTARILANQVSTQNAILAHERLDSMRSQLLRLRAIESSIKPTRVRRAPKLSAEPQGQSVGVLIALGIVLGLMLGVFAAFGREFVANAAAARDTD